MTVGWSDRRNPMTGVTGDTRANNIGAGMVGECIEETCNRMTGYAVRVGDRMSAGRDVGCSRCLAYGRNAIVTTRTSTRYTRMIKLAVRAKLEKTGGIVAVVALGAGRQMKIRFTDGHNVVMALAAIAKDFLVVDKRDYVKTQRGMTGLAHTAGSDVIRRLPRYLARPG